uniref:Uncharacterized protein n=1 Tax=Anopheles atroparvus TaxID=41427 RepID=A0AAG5DVY6_ANOAO
MSAIENISSTARIRTELLQIIRENNLIVSQPVPNMVTSQKDYATT